MDSLKPIIDLMWYFVPAIIVLIGMFLIAKKSMDSQSQTLRKFIEKDIQLKVLNDRASRTKESLPLKLQAYERLILFLERIGPNSILVRVHRGGMSAQQLQSDLIATIRAEFEHNLSQQLYVSDQSWEEVKDAKEDMIRMINQAFNQVGSNANGIQMSAALFEQVLELEVLPYQKAIDALKNEAKKLID